MKISELASKARKYLKIALDFLKKVIGLGDKADKALQDIEEKEK